jgi:hypothetical protein
MSTPDIVQRLDDLALEGTREAALAAEAAAEIRRLYAAPAQFPPVPLTEEQIEKLAVEYEAFGFGLADSHAPSTHGFDPDGLVAFVRAVERGIAHSSTETPT